MATRCDLEAFEGFLDSRKKMVRSWVQDVYVARSSDGLSFEEIHEARAMPAAAVPEVVRTPDGRYFLFYVEGDLDRARGLARQGPQRFRNHGISGHGPCGRPPPTTG